MTKARQLRTRLDPYAASIVLGTLAIVVASTAVAAGALDFEAILVPASSALAAIGVSSAITTHASERSRDLVDRQSSAARVIAQTRRRNEDLDNTRLLLYSATASYRRSVLPDSHLIGAVLNAVGHHSRLVKDGEALANLADLLSDESQTGQAMVECNRLVLTIGMMLGDG